MFICNAYVPVMADPNETGPSEDIYDAATDIDESEAAVPNDDNPESEDTSLDESEDIPREDTETEADDDTDDTTDDDTDTEKPSVDEEDTSVDEEVSPTADAPETAQPVILFPNGFEGIADEQVSLRSEEPVYYRGVYRSGPAYIDDGDVAVQMTGSYYTLPAEKILEQLNSYRLEACREGLVLNGKKLTMDDYHELRWSRAIENSVRKRAMESSITQNHKTLSSSVDIWDYVDTSNSGISLRAEDLAWNNSVGSSGITVGLNQFYSERSNYLAYLKDGVNHGVTGHYTSMIDPGSKYVAVSACKMKNSSNGWICIAMQLGTDAYGSSINVDTSQDMSSGDQTIDLAVSRDKISSVSVNGPASVSKGSTYNFSLSGNVTYNNISNTYGIPAGYNDSLGKENTVVWKSSDESVATVSDGIVTSLKGGRTTLTATVGNKTASKDIRVAMPLTSISLTSTVLNGGSVLNGTEIGITREEVSTGVIDVSYFPNDCTDAKKVTFKSSNTGIVSVDTGGKFTVKKPGKVTITATAQSSDPGNQNVYASFTLNITSRLQSIKLNKTSAILSYTTAKPPVLQLALTYTPADTTDDKIVTWKSSNESVAVVGGNGLVTAVSGGNCTITAVSGGCEASCDITVSAPLRSLQSNDTVKKLYTTEDTSTLTVTLDPVHTSDKEITFTAEDPSVFTVSNGSDPAENKVTVTAVSGIATVTLHRMSDNNARSTLNISGKNGTLKKKVEVAVAKPSSELNIIENGEIINDTEKQCSIGDPITVDAVVLPADSYDTSVLFESTNPAVARISNQTGSSASVIVVGEGEADIRAISKNASIPVVSSFKIISSLKITGIKMTRQSLSMYRGETAVLSAACEPEGIFSSISYSSDDDSIATVDGSGVITAVSAGTTTIRASSLGVSAGCLVTVLAPQIETGDTSLDGNTVTGIWIAKESFTDSAKFTGKAITQSGLRVYYNNMILKERTDYTLSYKNNINACDSNSINAPQVTVSLNGKYQGSKTYYYTIMPVDIGSESTDISVNGPVALTYSGRDQKLIPDIFYGTTKLRNNVDFKLTYSDSEYKTAGEHHVTVTGIGNYTGSRTETYYITDSTKNLSNATVTIQPASQSDKKLFYRSGITREDLKITVKISGSEVPSSCYDITDLPKSAGTANIKLIASSAGADRGYHGYKTVRLTTYADREMKDVTITGFSGTMVYDRSAVLQGGMEQPAISLSYKGELLVNDKDYNIKYSANTKTGTARVTFTGLGRYQGSVSKTYIIKPCTDQITVTHSDSTVFVKGGVTPDVTVTDADGNELSSKNDYTVTILNGSNQKPGTMSFKVSGKGDYKGYESGILYSSVKNGDLSRGTMKLSDKPYSVSKNAWKSTVSITDSNGRSLVAGKDYDRDLVYYCPGMNNQGVPDPQSTVYVTAVGTGDYKGSKITGSYHIYMQSISKLYVVVDDMIYTGSEIRPTRNTSDVAGQIHLYMTATDARNKENEILRSSSDVDCLYTVEDYSSNINAGTGRITLRGKGIYGGTRVVTFKIAKKIFDNSVHVSSLTLNHSSSMTFRLKEKAEENHLDLVATVRPDDAYNKKVFFTSSNTSVATVDSTGRVDLLKPGSVVISATTQDGAKKVSRTIKVTPMEPDYVWLGDSLSQGSLGHRDDNLDNAPYLRLQSTLERAVEGYGLYGERTNFILNTYLSRHANTVDPGKVYIFWVGSNDWVIDGKPNGNTAPVIRQIDAFLQKGRTAGKYIVIGTTKRHRLVDYYVGINKDLKDHYKDHYLDVIDIIDNAGGFGPDRTHLTQSAYDAVADAVYAKMQEMGYCP